MWAAVAALAISLRGPLPAPEPPTSTAGPAPAAKRAPAGRVAFRQGGKAFQLPLETAEVEVGELRGRRQYHVSLVYRDARNRLFAIAFVGSGVGPVPDQLVSDLTVSTPVALSKLRPGSSSCQLVITALDRSRVKGNASCRGLTGFDGEQSSPDVTQVRFTASR